MRFKNIFFPLLVCAVLMSCKKDELHTPVCDGSNPTYDADISLIIDQNCIQCHGANSSHGDFTTYNNMNSVITNGKFEQEVLTDQTMPQNGSLSQEQLNKIKCWVENGYPEN